MNNKIKLKPKHYNDRTARTKLVITDLESLKELQDSGLRDAIIENFNVVLPEDFKKLIDQTHDNFLDHGFNEYEDMMHGYKDDSLGEQAVDKEIDQTTPLQAQTVWLTAKHTAFQNRALLVGTGVGKHTQDLLERQFRSNTDGAQLFGTPSTFDVLDTMLDQNMINEDQYHKARQGIEQGQLDREKNRTKSLSTQLAKTALNPKADLQKNWREGQRKHRQIEDEERPFRIERERIEQEEIERQREIERQEHHAKNYDEQNYFIGNEDEQPPQILLLDNADNKIGKEEVSDDEEQFFRKSEKQVPFQLGKNLKFESDSEPHIYEDDKDIPFSDDEMIPKGGKSERRIYEDDDFFRSDEEMILEDKEPERHIYEDDNDIEF